jgi:NAD(P) transhydrogenase subunit alpha
MDTLSSQLGLIGYRCVIEAFRELPKISRMHMTPAGNLQPTKVFIIGCGVAGLAAILTAKSLGAKVKAYDVREAAKEQATGAGAQFVFIAKEQGKGEGQGGYASKVDEDFRKK